jgi:copper homeostasis protein (lipoprotein)
MFASPDAALVITQGHGSTANLVLRRVPPPPSRAGATGATPAPSRAASPAVTPPPPNPFTGLPASFTGTLPCADCQGIRYQLNLFADDSYFLRRTYIGKGEPVDRIGTWVISSDRRVIGLHDARGEALEYFGVRDARTLRALDRDGREFATSAASTLTRDARFNPVDVRLPLRGTYSYLADAATFTECTTGQKWPVAMEADNNALESAYTQARHAPGAPIMVELEAAQVVLRPHPDRAANVPTLVVHRFGKLAPGATCAPRYTSAPFETTTWRLTHLGNDAIPAPASARNEPTLTFEADSTRFSGSGGCNRFAGTYTTNGGALTMTAVGTMMACPSGGDTESRLMAVIKNTTRFRALGRTLELFDAAGNRLAMFVAR